MMKKSIGTNLSEKHLSALAEKNFLSLWSYPNVYYETSHELADLLVVCGNEIIIFQDKFSVFPSNENIEKGWEKWFRRTVVKGSGQVWGAERQIRNNPTKLFLDAACKIPLPISIPKIEEASFHLIVVTHGGSKKCREMMGGSGSFMLLSDIKGHKDHIRPFTIGDLNPDRTFVHVLDDTTLEILMDTLDTVTDFISYLRKKEKLLRSDINIFATGEEDLLSNYLRHVNNNEEHDFNFGMHKSKEKVDCIAITEGEWESFSENPQRLAQIEQNKISYLWDNLIETFNKHAIEGTQYHNPQMNYHRGVDLTEKITRFMAMEPRFSRRILSLSIMEILEKTPEDQRMIRIGYPKLKDGPCYVFLLFPIRKSPPISHDEYRKMRMIFLQGVCMVTRLKYPHIKHIIGIATESGLHNDGRSEDAIYLDASVWSQEMEADAKKFQNDFGVLINPIERQIKCDEYPRVVLRKDFLKNPRNKPCPCGSGKKYKYCCLEKGIKYYK